MMRKATEFDLDFVIGVDQFQVILVTIWRHSHVELVTLKHWLARFRILDEYLPIAMNMRSCLRLSGLDRHCTFFGGQTEVLIPAKVDLRLESAATG